MERLIESEATYSDWPITHNDSLLLSEELHA